MRSRPIRITGLLHSLALLCVAGWCGADRNITRADEGRSHWAFRVLTGVEIPTVRQNELVRNEIDRFIVERLERDGLTLSPEAERHALVRRAYFDLLGLPPTPAEIRVFLEDASPQAYERLLDRLLESPHFGERWGRHWLDNVGYVDVQGLDNDAGIISSTENKWHYRDYVIEAFNRDVQFDRFLVEQIAGDECVDWRNAELYTDETRRLLIATGFLRNSADDTQAGELNRRDVHQQILERTQEVVANNLLGLTLQCAKCHDHKYEPISQADYYRWQALFQPAFNPDKWLQPNARQIPEISAAEKAKLDEHNGQIEKRIGDARGRIAEQRRPHEKQAFERRLATLPEAIRADTQNAIQTPADKRNEVQKYLAGKFEAALKVTPEEVTALLTDADRELIAGCEREIAEASGKKRSFQHWQAVYDAGPPTPTRLLKRGNPLTPGEEIAPGNLSVLKGNAPTDAEFTPQFGSSGRRLALAKWLTDPHSPTGSLVIRVRVNRIWQVLFGRGIVETTDNFGLTGNQPTHPELLEWLSTAFLQDGQQLKSFLKRIMTSATYRQSSVREDESSRQADPGNRLLWKQRLRRLESEAVRDAILVASGKLDPTRGGAPIPVEPRPDGSFVVKSEGLPTLTSQFRRTVYLLSRRNYHPTLLSVFDQPNLSLNCSARSFSAVVLQSLTMLNDAFVLEQAESLAVTILSSSGLAGSTENSRTWISAAFERTLGRPPSNEELDLCLGAMQHEIEFYQQDEPQLSADEAQKRAFTRICHTLLNTSEFLVIP